MQNRPKIDAVVGRGGTPDPDCPNDPDSVRFWTLVARKRSGREVEKSQTKLQGNLRPEDVLRALSEAASSSSGPAEMPLGSDMLAALSNMASGLCRACHVC